MGIFFGTYSRTLDEKNRLQVPSKLVSDLPDKFYVLKGFEGCLGVYLEDEFHRLLDDLSSLSYREEKSRAYVRLTLASVTELEVDSHGRLPLGKDLVDSYHIGKDVVLIGALDHFEIWDANAYRNYESENASHYEELAEHLGKEQ